VANDGRGSEYSYDHGDRKAYEAGGVAKIAARGEGERRGWRLGQQCERRPTPQFRDGEGRSAQAARSFRPKSPANLDDRVQLLAGWPTPAARDWKSSASNLHDRRAPEQCATRGLGDGVRRPTPGSSREEALARRTVGARRLLRLLQAQLLVLGAPVWLCRRRRPAQPRHSESGDDGSCATRRWLPAYGARRASRLRGNASATQAVMFVAVMGAPLEEGSSMRDRREAIPGGRRA
jgi:hypothetical protein